MAALTLLALSGIEENSNWSNATKKSLTVSKGIMSFVTENYPQANKGRPYAPNSRETVRRQVLHQFGQARIVDYNPDNPDLPTNSPQAHYALTKDVLQVLKVYGTKEFDKKIGQFIKRNGKLSETYLKDRARRKVPLEYNGLILQLSPGKHNVLQAAIVQEFAPRFAPGASVLYIGDTAKKTLIFDKELIAKLNIPITEHDKLPDVVLYDSKRNWLFLIEAVTSHGPMTPKRIVELQEMLSTCKTPLVYITAFLDFKEFRKHMSDVSWETEIWIMEKPEHMIHFNGDRFMGPR